MAHTWFITGCLTVLVSASAFAQTPTGTMSGRVTDSSGGGVPGVTVAVTSPALQGTRTVVTNASGDYFIPSLPPGTYTATFTMSGFRTQERSAVVAATQVVTLDIALELSAVAEQVEVTGDTAQSFVDTTRVATSFPQELMTALPSNRSMDAAVLMAPAVNATGPSGNYSISGAPSYESLFTLNGVVVTENLRGQPYTLYIEDAIQETTVSSAGISAEFGRFTGGVVSAVTRSGGNRFSGSFRESFNNDSWRTVTPINESRLDKLVPTHEYTLGGPILRDRLWFFTAGRIQKQEASRTLAATLIPYVRTSDEKRYEGKGTFSPAQGHSVQASYIHISQLVTNNVFQNAMDVDSFYNQGQPQDLIAINYNGALSQNVFLEAQVSTRTFTFTGAGANSTDLIEGTLLIDRSRGGSSFRYHAATFCGVCGNDEQRNNSSVLVKGTYLLSTANRGTHNLVFGYDFYNDHRQSDNHQSGSDYRILGTSTVIRGTEIFPVFAPGSTIIQWNPIDLSSQGTDLGTHGFFVNDQWRISNQLNASLGLRFDRNSGEDAANNKVSDSTSLQPRMGLTYDPIGDGMWSISTSFSKYSASLNSSLADVSAAGNPATYQFVYQGPSVNPDSDAATLVSQDDAIRTVFDWYNANGGPNLPKILVDVPGLTSRIGDSLESPNVLEFAVGVGRQLPRGAIRADFVYRNFNDFYASITNPSTGTVTDPAGQVFDLTLLENTNVVDRTYRGLTVQGNYRFGDVTAGANYTLSRTWGNFDGEDAASGPLTTDLLSYPEFVDASWNSPFGHLRTDQRHKLRAWATYRIPMPDRWGGATLGVVHGFGSGIPYGAVGPVDPTPYADDPGYATPSGNRADGLWDYYFTARDAFRTESTNRTDLSVNYDFPFAIGAGRSLRAFLHAEVINVFNTFDLCACGSTVFSNGGFSDLARINTGVLTSANSGTLQPFNPFTETPVEGVHWAKRTGSTAFGTANSQFSYTTPRTLRFSLGVRF